MGTSNIGRRSQENPRSGVASGINFIETSPDYGRSEELIVCIAASIDPPGARIAMSIEPGDRHRL
jgi:aryl-alcohol dehydrogenase-like predicted oxidoreductase